jgi:hypothetical protein
MTVCTCPSHPSFKENEGLCTLIWSIKFKSWAGVKGVIATLAPSFNSRLPTMEEAVLDDTNPTKKDQGKAILQNTIAIDAMVQ